MHHTFQDQQKFSMEKVYHPVLVVTEPNCFFSLQQVLVTVLTLLFKSF